MLFIIFNIVIVLCSSYKSRSRVMEDFSPTLTRLPRSRSLSRLNGLTTQEISEVMQEKPVRHIQTQLEDSEARRTVLMSKLKEAQATLEVSVSVLEVSVSVLDVSVSVLDVGASVLEVSVSVLEVSVSVLDVSVSVLVVSVSPFNAVVSA